MPMYGVMVGYIYVLVDVTKMQKVYFTDSCWSPGGCEGADFDVTVVH